MKKKKNRDRLETFLIALHLVVGISLIIYPTISNILKNFSFQKEINGYSDSVDELDDNIYAEYFAAADEYNQRIAARGVPYASLNEEEYAEYKKQLSVNGTDVMGYIVISKINVSLPIYHGTRDAVLQSGTGHLEGTSLPVGGESTHSVICGHRGLPSATLFTHLDQLVIGDTFSIRVLNKTLTYEVDQIVDAEPTDWSELKIVEGKDYCTLLTCTPYGVNSKRLLVRGHRIETPEGELQTKVSWYQAAAVQNWKHILLIAALSVLALAVITTIIVKLIRIGQRKKHSDDAI